MLKFDDLSGLAPYDWEDMLQLGRDVSLEAGRVLFDEGSPATFLYVIKEGLIELVKMSESGALLRMAILDAGTVFGEGALFSAVSRSTTAVAFRDTVVTTIEAECLREFLNERAAFAALFYRIMCERLHQVVRDLDTDLHMLYLQTRKQSIG